jgi:hypothetical protein
MVEPEAIRKNPIIKPIPPDPILERKDKKSAAYANEIKKLQCKICFNIATQMACFDMDGAILIERYCDNCIKAIA